MVEKGLKLYGMELSPFILRVEWVLKLKGIEYEYVIEDLKNMSLQLLEYNPVHKAVPVLVHHGKPLCELTVILKYDEDAWKDHGPSILSSDPHRRAIARFWGKFCKEKCLHGSFDMFSKMGGEQHKIVKKLQKSLKILEGYLAGKKFFDGEIIGLVDIVAGWIPSWFPIIEEIVGIKIINEQELLLLCMWIHSILDLDLVKESMPLLDKVKARMSNIRESVLAAQLSS